MPVKWLGTFSENTPGISVDVNLQELIKQELCNTGDRPNIVIDSSSLSFSFSSKVSSSYILGQPGVTKMQIENFLEKIISFGANVIVVLRGDIDRVPHNWFHKAKNSLLHGKPCKPLKEQKEVFYKYVNSASYFCCDETLASFSNKHYTVFNSVNVTSKAVAEIAVKKKCLAVIGQDSNYLIYEGIRFYISVMSLDIETFSCKFFDRNELLRCLGLESYQLPMFATLCGNEIVPYYYLKSFHTRITGSKLSEVLLSVARIVPTVDPYRCIQKMVTLVGEKQVTETLIKESLDLYLKPEEIQPVNELLEFVLERLNKCDWNHKLYRIFAHRQYYSKRLTGIYSEDFSSFKLLRPLRRKLYGILLPPDSLNVEEYFLEEILLHEYRQAIPKVVYKISNVENPGLIELFGNRTPEMNLSRWKLFLSCVNETLSFSDIRIVPENYLFPVMALHYLHDTIRSLFERKEVFKQEFELEAFLLGVLLFEEFPRERLENIEEGKSDLWELQCHNLYLEVCFFLILLNQVCGFVISKEKCCICNFYDGKLTHWIYNKLKSGATCDEFFGDNMVLEALFYTLMDVIKT